MCMYALWSIDVTEAYPRSVEIPTRVVFVGPPGERANRDKNLLRLQKSLYLQSNTGAYWYDTPSNVQRDDVGLSVATRDPALYYSAQTQFPSKTAQALNGVVETQVYDVLGTGTLQFYTSTLRLEALFDSKPRESPHYRSQVSGSPPALVHIPVASTDVRTPAPSPPIRCHL